MSLGAGQYRHHVTVQREMEVVDPATGYRTREWYPLLEGVPARFQPGPGREYLASEAIRSEVSGRLTVRWTPDTSSIRMSDRVLWDGRTWELKSDPLPDETARKELTLMIGGVTRDPSV